MYKNVFNNFIEYIKNYDENYVVNLDPNNEFYIIKLCDVKILQNFFTSNDIFINDTGKFFMSYIPNILNPFISLFCCDISLNEVYNKIYDMGLAIQGCFNLNYIGDNIIYQGYNLNDNKEIEYNGKFPIDGAGYVVIQSHSNLIILNPKEMNDLDLFDVQFIKGLLLYKNGIPFLSLDKMKDIDNINIPNLPKKINGSDIKIDYNKLKIVINNVDYSFNDLKNKFNFKYPSFFNTNNGPLIIGKDKDNNTIIIYHDKMDIYNMMKILDKFQCKDAVLICNTSNLAILWKGANKNGENNIFNKGDFIGNTDKKISNIILFSK